MALPNADGPLRVLRQKLDAQPSVAIVCHQNPDGDAVGSSLGLAAILKKTGLDVQVLMPNQPPAFLRWINGFDQVVFHENNEDGANQAIEQADLLFCLDFNASGRTGGLSPVVDNHPFKVLVDHHRDSEDIWTISFSYPEFSSTCELIFDLIESLGLDQHIDKHIAEALYTGIMMDTGSFRYKATTPRTHQVAAKLLKSGIDQSVIHSRVFDSNTEDRMRLWGLALLERLRIEHEGQIAIIALSRKDLHRFRYRPGDTEGLVNQGLAIEGVRMAMFLAEQENHVKMSARSSGELPMNDFMRSHFNGGGHLNAAGGRSHDSLDETMKKVVEYSKDFLADNP